jgi:hypothetical protein
MDRPDASNEAETMENRIFDAQGSRNVLKQVTQHMLRCNKAPPSSEDDPVFFYGLTQQILHYRPQWRWILLRQWLEGPSFKDPTREDFRNYMEGRQIYSPYVSMTESPGRLFNYYKRKLVTPQIAVIDVSKLRRMNIPIDRSTDIADRFDVSTSGADATSYITRTQWLAQFWIPAACIIRMVSSVEFINACKKREIVDG